MTNECTPGEGASSLGLRRIGELNAYTFSFDEQLLSGMRDLYRSKIQDRVDALFGEFKRGTRSVDYQQDGHAIHVHCHRKTLLWFSAADWKTYGLFRDCFEAMGLHRSLKALVAHDHDIVMYQGFVGVSHGAREATWHVDFQRGANGYTLLTPLFDLDAGHGNLLYRDEQSRVQTYRYRVGEGLLVGDKLVHTTEPHDATDPPRVLLSLSAGTDRMAHWPILDLTVGDQTRFLMLPCGHLRGTCGCLDALPGMATPALA